jgi:exodeoxyribonuclease VII large subunit
MREPADTGGALTVTELTRRVKNLLEEAFPEVWVRGEVSNLRIQSSGHAYFTLKDANAQLSAVMFRGDLLRLPTPLREGAQVSAFGRLGVYEPRGTYQLVVRVALDDGLGRLRREFDALKAKLAAEGLFDSEKKRPLPYPSRVVGFVTSPTGAAIQDFVSVLIRRGFKGRLIVFPAKVQGAGAATEIAEQIRKAGSLGILDTLVVGRGGGSLEDLWPFNEEVVARAVAASPTPVISAVGHEIDFTLSDFAADKRAETPTAAAELISSNYIEAKDRLELAEEELHEAADNILRDKDQALDLLESRLTARSPLTQVRHDRMRMESLESRLRAAGLARTETMRRAIERCAHDLATHTPHARLSVARSRTESLAHAMETALAHRRDTRDMKLSGLEARLRAAGIDATLSRGFSVVKNAEGRVISHAGEVTPGKRLSLRFADGEAAAEGR